MMLKEELPLTPSPVARALQPIAAMLSAQAAGGVLLLASAIAALVWANSPWGEAYQHFWHTKLAVSFGQHVWAMSLEHWVNDGLMAIFFLMVGLEIKRELLAGELASFRRASLPLAGAIGGMVAPALIYFSFNRTGPAAAGWGVPMATDIAFAVGILALVGRGVPTSLKVFLLAVAIVDDLGAVIVIAVFYTGHISGTALAIAGACFVLLVVINALGVHRPLPYLLIGVALWAATLASGVHATIAGVLLGLMIPATRQIKEAQFITYMRRMLELFARDAVIDSDNITPSQGEALAGMEKASEAVQTPLALVEHALVRPVSLIIVPLFALANAGVNVRGGGASEAFGSPIMWGVALGLLIGKPIGILLASWLAIRAGIASLPAGASWRQMWGIGVLCGIGFTMSLFIANLAFAKEPALLGVTKVAVLTASTVAGVAGAALIAFLGAGRRANTDLIETRPPR